MLIQFYEMHIYKKKSLRTDAQILLFSSLIFFSIKGFLIWATLLIGSEVSEHLQNLYVKLHFCAQMYFFPGERIHSFYQLQKGICNLQKGLELLLPTHLHSFSFQIRIRRSLGHSQKKALKIIRET